MLVQQTLDKLEAMGLSGMVQAMPDSSSSRANTWSSASRSGSACSSTGRPRRVMTGASSCV